MVNGAIPSVFPSNSTVQNIIHMAVCSIMPLNARPHSHTSLVSTTGAADGCSIETFHQSNLKQKYCSATCRAKGVYANRKRQLAKTQQLPSITIGAQRRTLKQLESQFKDQKEDNE